MTIRTARVAPLLFVSGGCALIYQTTWLRELRLIFGGSTFASAAVLAIFMGGLGLGGALLGRRVDASASPLKYYAKLEILIAAFTALTPGLILVARATYTGLGGASVLADGGATVVRMVLAALVLAVPTLAMGGTLPAAARAVEDAGDLRRSALAVLYAVNTLGAVTGAVLATFFMLETFGNRTTLWIACIANLAIAGVAWVISRRHEAPGERTARARARASKPETPAGSASAPTRFVLTSAAVVGFVFFLMELVWYRMLGPILGGTTFTFGLILAVALFGIGLGGAAYAAWGRSRPATLAGFAFTCAAEALFIALPFALGDTVALFAAAARSMSLLGFTGLIGGWVLVAGLVVLPAAFVSGVQFPLLIALLGRGREGVGREVGLAYAWNTAGSMVGSIVGGFGLLPVLTAPGAWRLAGGVLAALALAAVAVGLRREAFSVRMLASVGVGALTVVLLSRSGPTAAWRHSSIGNGRELITERTPNGVTAWAREVRSAVTWEEDGLESSVAVLSRDGHAFFQNGKTDGNSLRDAPTAVMSGLLGTMLHPDPKRVMVIGLGTGSTAGWIADVPGVERVDVVEIEPAILRVAELCSAVNRNVLTHPKVRVVLGDAREALTTTPERYDLLFSEPSNPYRAGVSSLFTREFYESVAERMRPGAIFVQWIQGYEVDARTLKAVIATLGSAFGAVEIWHTQGADLLLVASREPIAYDLARMRARVAGEPYREALRVAWGVSSVEGVLSRFIARPELARRVLEEGGELINTDDRNQVEFAFARSVGQKGALHPWDMLRVAKDHGLDRPRLDGVNWELVELERLFLFARSSRRIPAWFGASTDATDRAEALGAAHAGDYQAAARFYEANALEPVSPFELALHAEVLAALGSPSARAWIEKLRAVAPIDAELIRARWLVAQGQVSAATDALVAGWTRHRESPWVTERLLDRSLALATGLARHDPPSGLRLFRALGAPFSMRSGEQRRRATRLELARITDFDRLCVEAFDGLEPHVPWNERDLVARAHCYRTRSDPRAARAQLELEQFRERASAGFAVRGPPRTAPEGGPPQPSAEAEARSIPDAQGLR